MARTWRDTYYVRTGRELAYALRMARSMARVDHPDTPIGAMMTPEVREVAGGWEVMVIGKPLGSPMTR